jgi:hypothetical protein
MLRHPNYALVPAMQPARLLAANSTSPFRRVRPPKARLLAENGPVAAPPSIALEIAPISRLGDRRSKAPQSGSGRE